MIIADDKARKEKKKPTLLNDSELASVNTFQTMEEMERQSTKGPLSPLTTLSDFMEWGRDQEPEAKKPDSGNLEDVLKKGEKMLKKPENNVPKKFSYIETLGGLRSPTISRH